MSRRSRQQSQDADIGASDECSVMKLVHPEQCQDRRIVGGFLINAPKLGAASVAGLDHIPQILRMVNTYLASFQCSRLCMHLCGALAITAHISP